MKILVAGGAGFIGVNTAVRLARAGHKITVADDLSRRGSAANLKWLHSQVSFKFVKTDIRTQAQVDSVVRSGQFDGLIHLAAQVAVTTSVTDPRLDFDINALGTFNLLEAVRRYSPKTTFLYASTNKVYGKMEDVPVTALKTRYTYRHASGISEDRPLDFYSPYGCSKGTADQYVRDYHRIYGLNTVVFRQSCIYGPRQFGVEDQGWVAWFIIAAASGRPITIYGDGKQVRDLLYVEDLARVYELALARPGKCAGKVYNIGGGPSNTLSLLELLSRLEEFLGRKIPVSWSDWRQGDQPIFVCDIGRAARDLGWKPQVGVSAGVEKLFDWTSQNLDGILQILDAGKTPVRRRRAAAAAR